MVEHCQFGDFNEPIRDRLVVGLRDTRFIAKILQLDLTRIDFGKSCKPDKAI